MLFVPFAFFGLMEGGLRLFGYGEDYPLFIPVDGFPDLLVQNPVVARRYFLHQRNVPNANADYFAREKPPAGLRVVALGESSTAGFPFYWGAAFPRVLGNRLQAAYPERHVEVINTAMAAINSYALLDFVDEVIAIEPDVVVVYAGHNEYYGALGAASSESLGRSPAVVRAFLSLRRVRTVELLRDAVGAAQRATRPAGRPDGTLMARMIGEQAVPLDGETFRAGHRQFVENMDRLLGRLAEAGVPTYVATLASNERDQRPFTTVHSADADTTAWRARLQAGLAASGATQAVAALEQAVRLDPAAAEGHFLLGRALLSARRPGPARAAFVRAKDRDALRFRAPEVFNQSIRRLAARHGATVVDVQGALRSASPVGIIGRETMMEHLHPNLEGYGRMADAFFDAMIADNLAGAASPTSHGSAYRVVSPMDSIVGYLRLDQLTRTWPFRPGEEQPFRPGAGAEPEVVELARAYYEDRLQWQEATFRLAAHYEAAGRLERAFVVRRALVQAYPFVSQHLTALGSLHMRIAQERGRPAAFADAESLFRAALARDARDATANSLLGALLLNRGVPAEATPYLERAVSLAPRDAQATYNLAGAYALTGQRERARRTAESVLRLQPGHPGAAGLLASLAGR
jgi:tetratricopeptide (TPR) repeat protein